MAPGHTLATAPPLGVVAAVRGIATRHQDITSRGALTLLGCPKYLSEKIEMIMARFIAPTLSPSPHCSLAPTLVSSTAKQAVNGLEQVGTRFTPHSQHPFLL